MSARRKSKRKATKKPSTKIANVTLNLDKTQLAYVEEVALYACVTVEVVLSVLMATGIYKAKRYEVPNPDREELQKLRGEVQAMAATLARCRNIMEANDPGNAREIFGPPLDGTQRVGDLVVGSTGGTVGAVDSPPEGQEA